MQSSFNEELIEQLNGLIHDMKARLHQGLRADNDGLAPMEARALNYFARNPGATQADLVQHSGRDKAQITRLIKRLLDLGLLTKAPDAADRRSHRLQLSEPGQAIQQKVRQHRMCLAADLVTDFSDDECRQLLQLLGRMRGNLRRQPGDAESGS